MLGNTIRQLVCNHRLNQDVDDILLLDDDVVVFEEILQSTVNTLHMTSSSHQKLWRLQPSFIYHASYTKHELDKQGQALADAAAECAEVPTIHDMDLCKGGCNCRTHQVHGGREEYGRPNCNKRGHWHRPIS